MAMVICQKETDHFIRPRLTRKSGRPVHTIPLGPVVERGDIVMILEKEESYVYCYFLNAGCAGYLHVYDLDCFRNISESDGSYE